MANEDPLKPSDGTPERAADSHRNKNKKSRRVGSQADSTKKEISQLLGPQGKPRMNAEYFWNSDIVNDDILAYSLEGNPCPPDELNIDEERLSLTGARPVIRTGAKLSGNEYLIRAARLAFTDLAPIAVKLQGMKQSKTRQALEHDLFQETLRRLMLIAGIEPKTFNAKNKYYRATFSDTRPTPQPEPTPPVAPQPPAPATKDDVAKTNEPLKGSLEDEKEDLVTGQLRPPSEKTDAESQNEGGDTIQPAPEEPTQEEPALIAEPVIEELPPDTPVVSLPPENTSASSEEQSPAPQLVEEEPILAELVDERSDASVQEQPPQSSAKTSFITRVKNFIWPTRKTRAQAVEAAQQQAAQVPATQQAPAENSEQGQRQLPETSRPAPVPNFPQSNSGMGPWHRMPPSVPFDEYLGELEGRNEAGTGTGDLLRSYMTLRRKRFGAVFGQKTAASKPAEEPKSPEQAPAEKKDAAPEKAKKAA